MYCILYVQSPAQYFNRDYESYLKKKYFSSLQVKSCLLAERQIYIVTAYIPDNIVNIHHPSVLKWKTDIDSISVLSDRSLNPTQLVLYICGTLFTSNTRYY